MYFDQPLEEGGMPALRFEPFVEAVPLHVAATFALCATSSLGRLAGLTRMTDEARRLADLLEPPSN